MRLAIGFLFFLCALNLVGCSTGQIDDQKIKDLEYTVVSEDRIPDKLKEEITQKREQPFKLTYRDGEYLYICQGFGKKSGGGYSIQVNDVYLTSNAIYFSSTLIGPSLSEPQTEIPTSPYIVVKTEYQDITVVFD